MSIIDSNNKPSALVTALAPAANSQPQCFPGRFRTRFTTEILTVETTAFSNTQEDTPPALHPAFPLQSQVLHTLASCLLCEGSLAHCQLMV